ncbi:MAG: hypothetical protein ACOYNB_13275 [Aquabacterium sp.]|uniref:hypothetical protein n=1 Tax=Aquabacterium sp. TaxID=1872578 RepID=UPI003BE4DDFE
MIKRSVLTASIALLMGAPLAQAGEAYVALGFPIVQVGYAHSVNQQLGLRADFGTSGSFSKDGMEEGIDYKGDLNLHRVGLFADYFPFSGGFRLTGGLTLNKAELKLNSNLVNGRSVAIGDQSYTPDGSEYLNVQVKMPAVMPYVGIGWGHQASEKGWGFVADLGVSVGKATLDYQTNLIAKSGGAITQADIDKEVSQLRDGVGKVTVLPQISLGVSYKF